MARILRPATSDRPLVDRLAPHWRGVFGDALIDSLIGRAILEIAVANCFGAAVIVSLAVLGFPTQYLTVRLLEVEGAGTVVYLGVSAVILWRVTARTLYPVTRPLAEHRDPTPEERAAALRLPWPLIRIMFFLWIVAAVVFTVADIALLALPVWVAVRLELGTLLAGVTVCTLAYLVLERALRPVLVLAIGGDPSRRPGLLGIGPRLVVCWALGSGVPLAGIVLAGLVAADVDRVRFTVMVVALAGVGLVAGAAIVRSAALAVSQPLEQLRAAMRRVEAGDLDARVPVDHGGELGVLEAGFDAMVVGLAERERLREVFGRHVGEDVAREALGHTRLGGEQREVSVLYVDVMGSTALSAELAPDELVALLNALFGAVVDAVMAEGGWVNKFEGDAALCVFGAPAPQDDHAARALRSAVTLRRCIEDLRRDHPRLDCGIGVSTGMVVVGNVGAEERYEYTVIGDAANEAARLADAAKAREERVLVSSVTVEHAGVSGWRDAGELELRGRAAATHAFAPAV